MWHGTNFKTLIHNLILIKPKALVATYEQIQMQKMSNNNAIFKTGVKYVQFGQGITPMRKNMLTTNTVDGRIAAINQMRKKWMLLCA